MVPVLYRLGVIAASVVALQVAMAAEPGKDQVKFESVDKNSDGKVSLSEASEHDALFVAFKNLDKDKDGMLTKEEFASYRASG
jgi:Ca2+-binding EF-hand superfamily protein